MKRLKPLLLIALLLGVSSLVKAHPSYGIAVDKHRNIYFPDLFHHGIGSIWKLSNKGQLELLFKEYHSHKVMLDVEENLIAEYVPEGDTVAMLIRLNKTGSIDTLVETSNWDKFWTNCAIGPNGNVYFYTRGYIWKRTADGTLSKYSDHHLKATQSIYADSEGIIYATDKGVGNGILVKIDLEGKATVIATDLISKLDRPRDFHNDVMLGITKGCNGHMYVAELAGKRIIKILENGEKETFYKAEDNWFPTGVDFFAGDAYILEYKTRGGVKGPRITRINESGEQEILFTFDSNTNWIERKIPKSESEEKKGELGIGFWLVLVLLFPGLVFAIRHLIKK